MSDDPETITNGDDREPEVTDDGPAGPASRRPSGDPPIRSAGAGTTPASDHVETTTNGDDREPEVTDDSPAGPDSRRPDGDPPMRRAGAGPTPASDTTPSARAGWQVRQLMMLGAGIAIIGLVAGASYYEGIKPDRAIEHPAPAPLPVRPCDWVREIDLQQRATRWWAAVEASLRNAPLTDTQTTMGDSVDEAFAPAYDRIPEFLDWHYSMAGQYTEVAILIARTLEQWGFVQAIAAQVAELVTALLDWLRQWSPTRQALERLAGLELVTSARQHLDDFRDRLDGGIFEGLPERMGNVTSRAEAVMQRELRDVVTRSLRAELDLLPRTETPGGAPGCGPDRSQIDQDAYEAMLDAAIPDGVRRMITTAVPTGFLASVAATRSAGAGTRVLKRLAQRQARRLVPQLARVVGVVGGAGVWLLLDSLALFADEQLTRDEFEAELAELVDEQRAQMKSTLMIEVHEMRRVTLTPGTPAEIVNRD